MPTIAIVGLLICAAIAVAIARNRGLGPQPANTWQLRKVPARGLRMGVLLEDAGSRPGEVASILTQQIRLAEDAARALADEAPAVVARGLEATAAERLRRALLDAGATARLASGDDLAEFELVLQTLESVPAAAVRTFRKATGADLAEAQAFVSEAPHAVKRLPVQRLAQVRRAIGARGDELLQP